MVHFNAPAVPGPGFLTVQGADRHSRSRALQPTDGRRIHAIGTSNRGLAFSSLKPSQRLAALVAVELELRPEFHAGSGSTLAAVADPIGDQFSLEFGNRGQDTNGQATMRRG